MATESVAASDTSTREAAQAGHNEQETFGPNWNWRSKHPVRDEPPREVFHRRLHQAESLSVAMMTEDFQCLHEAIRMEVAFLMRDLMAELRVAAEEARL